MSVIDELAAEGALVYDNQENFSSYYDDKVWTKISFLMQDRFPHYCEAVIDIVDLATSKHRLAADSREVAEAIFKVWGSEINWDFLEGVSEENLTMIREDRVSDDSLECFIESIRAWVSDCQDYISELDELDASSLTELYNGVKGKLATEVNEQDAQFDWALLVEDNIKADFAYWTSLAKWTVEEATALSLGKNPDAINLETVNRHLEEAERSPLGMEFKRRYRTIDRAVTAGQLLPTFSPIQFVTWSQKVGVSLAADLVDWGSSKLKKPEATLLDDEEPMETREQRSLYKLFIGMAIANYDLDPRYNSQDGSPAFSAISDDLQRVGLALGPKTIRIQAKKAFEAFAKAYPAPIVPHKKKK